MSGRGHVLAFRYRESVGLYISAKLGRMMSTTATTRPTLGDDGARPLTGDVEPLSRWMLRTRVEAQRDLSGALDAVERDAETLGRPFAAVIFKRHARGIEQSYALVSLAKLAALIAETERAES